MFPHFMLCSHHLCKPVLALEVQSNFAVIELNFLYLFEFIPSQRSANFGTFVQIYDTSVNANNKVSDDNYNRCFSIRAAS